MLGRIVGWIARMFGISSGNTLTRADPSYEIQKCDQCGKRAVFHVTHVRQRCAERTTHYCDSCSRKHVWIPSPNPAQAKTATSNGDREVGVELEKVLISEIHYEQFIVFLDAERNRHLGFGLGTFEALVIDRSLKETKWPRPMTHDAWLATIKALGASVQSCCVHDRQESTYFAELRLLQGQSLIRVDIRPSDAFAIALKTGVPFFFTERLLANYAVIGDEPK
jgi:uncharacterized protein